MAAPERDGGAGLEDDGELRRRVRGGGGGGEGWRGGEGRYLAGDGRGVRGGDGVGDGRGRELGGDDGATVTAPDAAAAWKARLPPELRNFVDKWRPYDNRSGE